MSQPSIATPRLVLRPFRPDDGPAVQALAGERDIADTTLNIPHPYEDGMAEDWIAGHASGFADGTIATFAIELKSNSRLVGAISLRIERSLNKAELGYWVGKPYWNCGFATEATIAILEFGFKELRLNRIQAKHLGRNPASGRVMAKAGMNIEGTARQDTIKWGRYEDLVSYGLLREDWLER